MEWSRCRRSVPLCFFLRPMQSETMPGKEAHASVKNSLRRLKERFFANLSSLPGHVVFHAPDPIKAKVEK
jgi:hypothetical protein